jgi:ATP phosphoribosyltransferase regulatory subunit
MEALLPPRAKAVESLRTVFLERCALWGYQQVIPPLLEQPDALFIGTGQDLRRLAFHLTDPHDGTLLAIRPDLTPQVARLDTQLASGAGIARLCYAELVARTKPETPGGPRLLYQAGAELYGNQTLEADAEAMLLALEVLKILGCPRLVLSLGEVRLHRLLMQLYAVDDSRQTALLAALQAKAGFEVRAILQGSSLDRPTIELFVTLARLYGGLEVLDQARTVLPAHEGMHRVLDDLQTLAGWVAAIHPDVELHIDLAECCGFSYHTGVVFAAYHPGLGCELARGGRYDQTATAAGQTRCATGFSVDLAMLLPFAANPEEQQPILAPCGADPRLYEAVSALRGQGQRVIQVLPGTDPGDLELSRRLVWCPRREAWLVES